MDRVPFKSVIDMISLQYENSSRKNVLEVPAEWKSPSSLNIQA